VDLVGRIADWLARDVAGHDDRPTRWLETPPPPETPRFGEAATTIVLGHPATDPGASAVWRRQVICLGSGGLHPGDCLDDDLSAPAAVLVRPGRERSQIERLSLDNGTANAGWQDDGCPVRGVWLSVSPRDAAGIVDAA
jgi:hypothetical protein